MQILRGTLQQSHTFSIHRANDLNVPIRLSSYCNDRYIVIPSSWKKTRSESEAIDTRPGRPIQYTILKNET